MEALAAVLLQLDLRDPDPFLDRLAPSLPSQEAVGQLAAHRDGPPLLGDLVSSLKGDKRKGGGNQNDSKYERLPNMLRHFHKIRNGTT